MIRKSSKGETLTGFHAVCEAIQANRRKIHALYLDRSLSKGESERVHHLEKLAKAASIPIREGRAHSGGTSWVSATVDPYPYVNFETIHAQGKLSSVVLACDQIQDPQNLGSILRSFYAFGGKSVLIPQNRSALITESVCRASAGAVEHLQIIAVTNLSRSLEELKKLDYWIVVTALREGQSLDTLVQPKVVVVLGNEQSGISSGIQKRADLQITIPIHASFDSLNVAACAAIIFYELGRKLRSSTP